MIERVLKTKIIELRDKFPVISLTGPRQSGKTTLLKSIYTDIPYVNLEDVDILTYAIKDPRGFLSNYPNGAVFDEIQRVPELFSYLQGIVDEKQIHFVLSGSQNFLLMQNISQSLAGRTAILKLLPFSLQELESTEIKFNDFEECTFRGMYPRIYDKNIDPNDFYPSYISTYIERDIRQLKNIENLISFSLFLQLCAGRCGQIVNINSLATDAGISPNTAKAWLSVLEASYIIYFLQPHHKNFNKRLIKTPKLYFFDTGLACSLLGIESSAQLRTHYQKGALFENIVVNEFVKFRYNNGQKANCYFWQNQEKKEIDLLIESAGKILPFEIKSGKTIQEGFFNNLRYWQKLTGEDPINLNVIFGGENNLKTSSGNFISWRHLAKLIKSSSI